MNALTAAVEVAAVGLYTCYVWYHMRQTVKFRVITGKKIGIWVSNAEAYRGEIWRRLQYMGVRCRELNEESAQLLAAAGGFWRTAILGGQSDLDMVVTVSVQMLTPINYGGKRRYCAYIKAYYPNGAHVDLGEFMVESPDRNKYGDVDIFCARVARRIASLLYTAVTVPAPEPGFRYDPDLA